MSTNTPSAITIPARHAARLTDYLSLMDVRLQAQDVEAAKLTAVEMAGYLRSLLPESPEVTMGRGLRPLPECQPEGLDTE